MLYTKVLPVHSMPATVQGGGSVGMAVPKKGSPT
jgi:hypothetical protein